MLKLWVRKGRETLMPVLRSLYYFLLKLPLKLLVRCKVIPDNLEEAESIDHEQPIFTWLGINRVVTLLPCSQHVKN